MNSFQATSEYVLYRIICTQVAYLLGTDKAVAYEFKGVQYSLPPRLTRRCKHSRTPSEGSGKAEGSQRTQDFLHD